MAPPGAPLEIFASIGFTNVLLMAMLTVGACLLAIDTWRPLAFALSLLSFGLASWTWAPVIERYEPLPLALTALGPLALLAGAAVKLGWRNSRLTPPASTP